MDRGPRDHFTGHHYDARHATGPVSFLNPTVRYLPLDETSASPGVYHVWRSRDNRKGRHAALVTPSKARKGGAGGGTVVPPSTSTLGETLRGIGKMFMRYPVWDVSYDVAMVFTLGSVIWVINSFFVWLPLAAPSTEFNGEETMAGGVSAFIGATVFEFGALLALLEAVNENRSDCFGWALEAALENSELSLRPNYAKCQHHHSEKRAFLRRETMAVKKGNASAAEDSNGTLAAAAAQQEDDQNADAPPRQPDGRRWAWFPTWYELRTHYMRELGFLACAAQMFGATIFWISGFTGLPPIYNVLSVPATNGIYWLPQVVGGTGFIVSALLFMIEMQSRWYLPALNSLGWHIGFWNLVGAIGFTLCGALGFASAEYAAQYASTMSTFVGSWAFLIGSVIQWYESLSKYPIWAGNAPSALLDTTA